MCTPASQKPRPMETWKAPGQGEQACVFIESSKVNILQCGSRCLERGTCRDIFPTMFMGGRTLCSVPAQRIFTFVAFAAQVCMGGLGNSVSEVTCTEAFCFR